MKFLLLCVGLLLLTLGSGAFFVLLMRGSESNFGLPSRSEHVPRLGAYGIRVDDVDRPRRLDPSMRAG